MQYHFGIAVSVITNSWSRFRLAMITTANRKSRNNDGVGRRVRHNGLSTCPSALCRQRVLPPHGLYRAPCPSHAPVNDGPRNCRPYFVVKRRRRAGRRPGDWPSLIWVFTYRKKFVFVFLLLHYFQTHGTGRRWQEAGTITPGQT